MNPDEPHVDYSAEVIVTEPQSSTMAVVPMQRSAQEPAKTTITAAQGKVEAIANLTMKAYERAATLQITPEEVQKLSADFPDDAFKPGAAGKENLLYIEHAFLRERLNHVFGMGQWAIIPRNRWAEEFTTAKGTPGSRVYVEAMLVIRGCFVAEAVGAMEYYPKNESQNYSDAVEGAKTAALRRCAKELGVGLQAWKKDWCDGWWARKRGGASLGQAPKASQPAKPTPAPPPKPQPASVLATEAFKAKMLEKLHARPGEPEERIVTEYFQAINALLPNETLADLKLLWVPVSEQQMNSLAECIAEFSNGDPAMLPYRVDLAPAPTPLANVNLGPAKPPPAAPHIAAAQGKDPEWFMSVIVPVPRKNMKRDAYLHSPDTIRSLYEARHGNDEDSQEARRRLWGFVNNYEAKGWVGRDGKQRPPSQTDIDFRAALDAFADWHEKNHPGEKL